MKALIEITGGEAIDCETTFYIPERYFNSDSTLDFSKLGTYDCYISINVTAELHVVKMAITHHEEPRVWVHHTSIFSKSNFKSNVGIDKTYDFGLFGWIGFGIVNLLRKIGVCK